LWLVRLLLELTLGMEGDAKELAESVVVEPVNDDDDDDDDDDDEDEDEDEEDDVVADDGVDDARLPGAKGDDKYGNVLTAANTSIFALALS
jgi:hypothetical protein